MNLPADLKVNHLENPLGLGDILPVLSWRISGSGSSAWQILVADSEEKLAKDEGNLWDSGKVEAQGVNETTYSGQPLRSRQQCWWKVRAWDGAGQATGWSQSGRWETGLLEPTDWQAGWIGSSVRGGSHTSAPAPYFRKEFTLPDGVVEARIYATSLGVYDWEINGQRGSTAVFAPGWTDYKVRVAYQAYDVTSLLKKGDNAIGVVLGDGWYCGYLGWFGRQRYGEKPALLLQLELSLADGSRQVISTDSSWKTTTGPILENDLLMGEAYDARLDLGAWSSAGYDDSAWNASDAVEVPAISISPTLFRPVERKETLSVAKIVAEGGERRLYDFGQNFSGRVRITVKGQRGVRVTLRHGEILDAAGRLYTENLRSARATDRYALKGEGTEVFEPRFTFHGFRYLELISSEGPLTVEKVEGIVLQSDLPETGTFACSNPLLNQLQHNIRWGLKSNFLEVPTDCPQRDERMGWTGDAQVFIRTAAFNADVQAFFHKWMRDARDSQRPDGSVPCVIPEVPFITTDGGPAWSDATVICPWTIYLCYGDKRILADHFDSMERYIDYLVGASKDLIRCHPEVEPWGGFGDWLALDGSSKNSEGATPKDLIGTAFLAHDALLMAKIADVLGRADDAKKYRDLREKVAAAFVRRFITQDGLVAGATQTAYVLALHFDLLPEDLRANATKELVRKIEKNDIHIGTGFVGTPYICEVLEENGHLDLAYKLLEQETFPSWLFPIKNGATTIWERWDGWTPEKGFQDVGMNSFNHYAYGAIGAWMYRTVAGIELDPKDPGYRHIIFRPRPGGTITWAEASLETLFGKTAIKWKLQDNALQIDVTVPPNSRATLRPPEGFAAEKTEFEAGSHQLTLKRQAA